MLWCQTVVTAVLKPTGGSWWNKQHIHCMTSDEETPPETHFREVNSCYFFFNWHLVCSSVLFRKVSSAIFGWTWTRLVAVLSALSLPCSLHGVLHSVGKKGRHYNWWKPMAAWSSGRQYENGWWLVTFSLRSRIKTRWKQWYGPLNNPDVMTRGGCLTAQSCMKPRMNGDGEIGCLMRLCGGGGREGWL